jgi:hypothetical protein
MGDQRYGLSQCTIDMAKKSGQYTDAQIQYFAESKVSFDPRDLVWHNAVIDEINPSDLFQQQNNS